MDFRDLQNISEKELSEMLAVKRGELKDLRFAASASQLKQVHKISLVKKEIAQILTVLKQNGKK
jgi:ribosomal protein L29